MSLRVFEWVVILVNDGLRMIIMATFVKWFMGDLAEARRRQVELRINGFREIGRWKQRCPVEVAKYYEWHIIRGLEQQKNWLDDPSSERSWQQIREIDQFIANYDHTRPHLLQKSQDDCGAACGAVCHQIHRLLRQDKQSVIHSL